MAKCLLQQEFQPPDPNRCCAGIVIESVNRAVGQRQVEPEQHLIHSDQRSQFRPADDRTLLGKKTILCRISAKGCS